MAIPESISWPRPAWADPLAPRPVLRDAAAARRRRRARRVVGLLSLARAIYVVGNGESAALQRCGRLMDRRHPARPRAARPVGRRPGDARAYGRGAARGRSPATRASSSSWSPGTRTSSRYESWCSTRSAISGRTCFTPTSHRRWWRRPCVPRWLRRSARCRSTTSSPPARRRSSRTCGASAQARLDRYGAGLPLGRQPAVGETAGRGGDGVPRSERRQGRRRQGGQRGTERARARAQPGARRGEPPRPGSDRSRRDSACSRRAARPSVRRTARSAAAGLRCRPMSDLYLPPSRSGAAARQARAARARIRRRAST